MSVERSERFYRERSLWLAGLPGAVTARASLGGDAAYDVAVVGAGFTGLWSAYYLKRSQPDLRVVVLEREIAGFGPSGRNGGWVSGGIAGSWRVYAERAGAGATLRAERATWDAVDEVGAVAAAEGIECGYRKAGTIAVATSGPQVARLTADVEMARSRGVGSADLRVLDPTEREGLVHVHGARYATYSPHCARVDPARMVRGLADACERLGVVIHEQTPVHQISRGRLRCAGGTVSAAHVLVTTESYTVQQPGQRLRFLPLYSLMIATEPLPERIWEQLGWRDGLTIRDRRHLFFYAQRTTDDRIAIGGRGAPYRLNKPIDEACERNLQVRARLEATVRREFPAAADAVITHHWGGPLAVPRDWSMGVSYDRVTGMGWAAGYSGHGVVAANISGRTLADLVLGRDSDLVTLPWVGHRARNWEPEPLRYMASTAIVKMLASCDRYEDRTDRVARRQRLLAPVMPPV